MARPRGRRPSSAGALLVMLAGCATLAPGTPMTTPSAPLHRWQLPNGLVVLFREDHASPLLAAEAVVKTGSATEGAWLGTGISHVLEHMLFKGTASRPVGAIEREIKSYGGQINAHTSYDTTGYALTVHRDHARPALELLADALQRPSFDPGELTKELEVVCRELRLRHDDPDQRITDLVWATRYLQHPYRHPIIGYEPLLRGLTRDQLVAYHRRHYHPNQTVLGIVGDVTAAEVRAAVEAAFGGWRRGIEPTPVWPQEPEPVAPRLLEETAEVALAQVVLAFPSVSLAHPDLAALDTLARVLGEGRGSRLDLSLRETGIVHGVASWHYAPQGPGLFAVSLRLDPGRIEEAILGVWRQIERLTSQPVAADELQAAKRAVTAQYLFSRQTVAAQAGDLAASEALVGDAEFSRHYVEQVQRVTTGDLARVAQAYLARSRVSQVVLRPAAGGPVSDPQVPAAGQAPIELVTLGNGLRVLLRTDPRLPIVTLRITAWGGLLAEWPAAHGLSMLAARMLLRGTAARSAQELTDVVRSLGGELASTSGRNSLGVSAGLLRQDAIVGLELLSDLWQHPAFPADEFLKEQRLLQAEITSAEDDLFQWGGRRLFPALFPGHPYGAPVLGTPDTVARLSVEDLRRFHRTLLNPSTTLLSIFGDVSRGEVVAALERTFGQIPPGAPVETMGPPAAPLTRQARVEGVWPREEAIVLLGFHGPAITDPDAAALDVMDVVLGGPGGRLFTEVRERRGQAYTVGSYLVAGPSAGAVILYAATDPSQAEGVMATLLQETRRLRDTAVPAEELAAAKAMLIGSQSIRIQANPALGLQTSLDELFGLGWAAYREYPQKVSRVTAADLRRVAQRYLTPERCAVFIGRPKAGAPPGVKGRSPSETVPAGAAPQEAR